MFAADNLQSVIVVIVALLSALGLYFLVATRVSLIIQSKLPSSDPATAHIYWIYKSPLFIRLTDRMFVVSTILLFQYSTLVRCVVRRLNPSLKDKSILQMSCAFGNVSEKIAEKCQQEGAKSFVVTDIMQSEIDNAERKLKRFGNLCTYSRQDVTRTDFSESSFDYVVMFFLPHEVPYEKKEQLVEEAGRLIKPGGKMVVGEFHKPRLKILEILGRIYFFIFEPYATEMWYKFDLAKTLEEKVGHPYRVEKETFLFDNFQVVTATRLN